MAILITGGSGFIGSHLARLLVERGEEAVVFDKVKTNRLSGIEDKLKLVLGDLSDWSEVLNVVRDRRITSIYHLGSLLTFESEASPSASFHSNVIGTYNVLEAARLFKVEKIVFTSSIGAFGENTEGKLTDVTIQRPTTLYGAGKLYCEGLGKFYRRKFGLDFRSIRYPSVVGPGVTTPNHWDVPMIQHAILGKAYHCPVPETAMEPMVYYKDAVRAAESIWQAPRETIRMVNYNVGGLPTISARDLESAIRKYYPDASISYAAPSPRPPGSPVKIWDDSYARQEWGWNPEYTSLDQLVSDFIQEMKKRPELYRGY